MLRIGLRSDLHLIVSVFHRSSAFTLSVLAPGLALLLPGGLRCVLVPVIACVL